MHEARPTLIITAQVGPRFYPLILFFTYLAVALHIRRLQQPVQLIQPGR
jgi:hypothetical protein